MKIEPQQSRRDIVSKLRAVLLMCEEKEQLIKRQSMDLSDHIEHKRVSSQKLVHTDVHSHDEDEDLKQVKLRTKRYFLM